MWPQLEKHILRYVLKWIWHYWYIIEPEWRFWTRGHWCREASAQRVLVQTPACPYTFSPRSSEYRWASPPSPAGLLGTDWVIPAVGPVIFAKPLWFPGALYLWYRSILIDRAGDWRRGISPTRPWHQIVSSVALNDIIKGWIHFWSNIVIHSISLFIKAHWLVLLQQGWAMNCPSIIIIVHII